MADDKIKNIPIKLGSVFYTKTNKDFHGKHNGNYKNMISKIITEIDPATLEKRNRFYVSFLIERENRWEEFDYLCEDIENYLTEVDDTLITEEDYEWQMIN